MNEKSKFTSLACEAIHDAASGLCNDDAISQEAIRSFDQAYVSSAKGALEKDHQSYVETIRKKIGHDLLLLAGANVVITRDDGSILLQLRRDGTYGLPGGLLEPGESLLQCAIRETQEECGVLFSDMTFVDVFSGAEYTFTLANEDQINVITAVYHADLKEGSGEVVINDDESKALCFFSLSALPDNMNDEYRVYISAYIENVIRR
ncbi:MULTISPECIES: NUDIX hydrolase [unclassified Serratia (in: enterobacteria)]|uniref:NUDIX hydrolase n=1 Tax=unclassified Serratia (in: enterobacteria) TaxID=2647522 RepID=UPI0004691F9C|nr:MULTISPECIES: NUDIX domain-containing protein [unclassified Serratia (in: enterobacteria)]